MAEVKNKEAYDPKEENFIVRNALRQLEYFNGCEDEEIIRILKDILSSKDMGGIPLTQVKEEFWGEPMKILNYYKETRYDNGKRVDQLSLMVNGSKTSVSINYLKQIVPGRRYKPEPPKSSLFERLFSKKKQEELQAEPEFLIPEDEEFRELRFNFSIKQGRSPSLDLSYIPLRTGNGRSAFYYLNEEDGSIIQSRAEGEIYK